MSIDHDRLAAAIFILVMAAFALLPWYPYYMRIAEREAEIQRATTAAAVEVIRAHGSSQARAALGMDAENYLAWKALESRNAD